MKMTIHKNKNTVDNLEEDLIQRKHNIATLSKEIYRMLMTPPFVVKKPTGIDFIQQQLQSQCRDHVKTLKRAQAKNAGVASALERHSGSSVAFSALGKLEICFCRQSITDYHFLKLNVVTSSSNPLAEQNQYGREVASTQRLQTLEEEDGLEGEGGATCLEEEEKDEEEDDDDNDQEDENEDGSSK